MATGDAGAVLSRQEYTPWGDKRTGGILQTELDYTGQRRDGTGLLYYNARYYDPALGRFLSPDTIVPRTTGTALTVDFHDVLVMGVAKRRSAPHDPQALNRYAYVLNNPLRYTDPTGHCPSIAVCHTQNDGGGGGPIPTPAWPS